MKAEAKAFSPSPRLASRKRTDVREMCGRLTFVAQSDVDATQLAALYAAWFGLVEDKQFKAWRKRVLMAYCKKHKVTIKFDGK